LEPEGHPKTPADCKTVIPDEAQCEGKKQARVKKENVKAVAYYALLLKSARLRGMVNKAKTNEWPGVGARNIRESLVNKSRPDAIIVEAEARIRRNDTSTKKHKYPAILFEELAAIEMAYAYTTAKITKRECIGVVLATSLAKYHAVLTTEKHTKGSRLTIDNLEYALNQLQRQGCGSQKKYTRDDGGEIMLAAFGGTCYNCQEKGHRANQCPKKTGPRQV
jgi:hypothetical protein